MIRYNLWVTCSKNNVISKNNKFLFFNPHVIEEFKTKTAEAVLVLGRKTWEVYPNKWLRKRIFAVLTHNTKQFTPSAETVFSPRFFSSLDAVDNFIACYNKTRDVYVVSGLSVYEQYLKEDKINKIYVAEMKQEFKGSLYFPQINSQQFAISNCDEFEDWKLWEYKHY